MIRMDNVELEEITVRIRELHSKVHTEIKIDPRTTINDFIDSKLHSFYGYNSKRALLVHIGRQLKADKSLKEELIEDGAEILCVSKDILLNAKGPIRDGH